MESFVYVYLAASALFVLVLGSILGFAAVHLSNNWCLRKGK